MHVLGESFLLTTKISISTVPPSRLSTSNDMCLWVSSEFIQLSGYLMTGVVVTIYNMHMHTASCVYLYGLVVYINAAAVQVNCTNDLIPGWVQVHTLLCPTGFQYGALVYSRFLSLCGLSLPNCW